MMLWKKMTEGSQPMLRLYRNTLGLYEAVFTAGPEQSAPFVVTARDPQAALDSLSSAIGLWWEGYEAGQRAARQEEGGR